jgi:hypothetical protein
MCRDIPVTAAGGSAPTASCAETPLQVAPRSGGRPSTRNSSRPPAQEQNEEAGLGTDSQRSEQGPISSDSAADTVQEGAAEKMVEVAATGSVVVDASTRESLERDGNTPLAIKPMTGEESGRAPAGDENASKDAEEERAILTRRRRQNAANQDGAAEKHEQVAKKGRKRKAKQGAEEAHAEDEVSPAGNELLGQTEEVPIQAPEAAAQQPEAEQKSAVVDESGTADESVEKEPRVVVQPSGRVTRRMAKVMGGELEALPSGLADGNEVKTKRGGRGRKNRRRDLDESAIREQALKQEIEAEPEAESKVEAELNAKTEEKEEVSRRGDAPVGGEVTPTKQGGEEAGRDGVPSREEDAATGVDLENATIPETPQERAVQRPQRAARAKTANVDVPGGRVTRAMKEKGELDADVSKGSAEALSTEKGTEEGAAGLVKDADAPTPDDINGQQMEEQMAVQESEDEALVKKKGGKKQAKGKKKGKGGKQQLVEAASEKEVVDKIQNGLESVGAELPLLSPRSGGKEVGRLVCGSDASKEDDRAEKEVIAAVQTAGPVSSPPEVPTLEQSPLADATLAPTGPLEVRETRSASAKKATTELPQDKSTLGGSPGHRTPKPCLSTSSPPEKGASSEAKGSPSNVAFGSPIDAAPDSGVKRSAQRTPDSPSRSPRSASKPAKSSPAPDPSAPQQVDVAGDVTPTVQDVAASRNRSVSELLHEVTPLLRPQVAVRIARSGSKGPDSKGRVAHMFPSPTQEPIGRVTRSGSQAPVSFSREIRSPLSPAKEAVGRVTRSASGGKSSSGKPGSSPPGSFSLKSNPARDADQIGGSGKRTRGVDELTPVPNQSGLAAFSPERSGLTAGSAERGGLAAGSAEKGTPETGGVLTRSQGKLRRSADVIPSPSSSLKILAGDLSGIVTLTSTVSPQRHAPTLSQITPPQTQASPAAQPSGPGSGLEAKPQKTIQPRALRSGSDDNPQNPDGVVAKTAVALGAAAVSGARRLVGKDTKGAPLLDGGPLSEPESPPTVDMDVCTTPFTARSRKVPRPATGKRNALGQKKESTGGEGFRGSEVQGTADGTSAQKGVKSEKGKGDVMSHLRRSPRLQQGHETDLTSAEEADVRSPFEADRGASVRKSERIKERSAKKMRLSAGFAVGFGRELIDLENEDEDLMEANFEVNSDGLRRSARKAADQTAKSLSFNGEEGPGKNRLSFREELSERAGEMSSNVRKGTPGRPKEESAFRFSAKKPIRSVKKSARKTSSGRPSFVSASEDGSDGAGFGGLEASSGGADGGGTAQQSGRQKTPAKRSNLIASGFSSFLSFMTKKEPAGPPIPGNNKNTVKVSVKQWGLSYSLASFLLLFAGTHLRLMDLRQRGDC